MGPPVRPQYESFDVRFEDHPFASIYIHLFFTSIYSTSVLNHFMIHLVDGSMVVTLTKASCRALSREGATGLDGSLEFG